MRSYISNTQLIDFNAVAWFIMVLFDFLSCYFYLTFDRTNWKWGKKDINILMLAIAYKGIAIPIYWILLNKKGNSSTRERIALTQRFITQFGKKWITKFLADREFVGKKWFEWLKSENIDFAIRIKKNNLATNSRGEFVPVQNLFRNLKVGETMILMGARTVYETSVYLSALRLEDGELLIVATAKCCTDAIESYAKRWEIETLFSCLKSRGFNFEDTHVTDRRRIKSLLFVLVIAFCWAHRVGEWHHENVKPIKLKKHQRPEKSIFRLGLDVISECLFKLKFDRKKDINSLFLHLILKQNECCG
jgi:transposase